MCRRAICSAIVVCLAAAIPVEATEAMKFTNDTDHVMELWLYPYLSRHWQRPPNLFAPGEHKTVYFNTGEEYFLVFRDHAGTEVPIGRYNITKVLQQNPTYEVSIRLVFCKVAETLNKEVWCPLHQTTHLVPSTVERMIPQYVVHWRGWPVAPSSHGQNALAPK